MAQPLFQATSVTVAYRRGGRPFAPFSGVNLSLEAGRMYDLVGPSGSGKSTLLEACARTVPRSAGELFLAGESERDIPPVQWRRRVCLVPQVATLVPGTVGDNLRWPWTLKVNAGAKPPSDAELVALLEKAELGDVPLDRDAAQLSGGQRARVAVLRAFATSPQVLLLDEVDAALDDESALAVGRLTRELVHGETACLRIRHRQADGLADGTFTLADGRLSYVEGSLR
ncbi:ATP-binding cassette domain-containing protein [Olsenella sp. YH-ols2217]|uniref:ATP-binding cassette domain-containing protein n=1 Tax=Kribbibacterium absianum TaxID=3044210 RepID=A0ABT6ZHY5_9ACTN|nr:MULTISPECIES: ATP-binding cassette domain-containing protein [unclassified Olsenella]MDJ1121169.1 ATP-binding cassette domain-containing protein [Olsenella sp. YH-ols2216]MDJ1128660.1 ATP-binding cassette domain-containing protein [Olsenella sp. YH-ols2217]